MRKSSFFLAVLLVLVLAPPAGAATPLQKLMTGYGRTHEINPCKHTTQSLQAALSAMTPALIKAQPLFYAALQTALSTRQAGLQNCAAAKPKGAATPKTKPVVPVPPAVTPAPAIPATPAPVAPATTTLIPQPAPAVQTTTQHKISIPALLLAGLLLAAALLGLLGAAATSGGRAPRGLEGSRHAFGEAAFRVRQAVAEFGDWVRLGR